MKRILPGLILFVLFTSTQFASAQVTIEISSQQIIRTRCFFPVYARQAEITNVRSAAMWKRSELELAGIPPGATIISVAFKRFTQSSFNTVYATPIRYKMYMATTIDTLLAFGTSWASITESYDLVYSNDSFNVPAVSDWIKWNIAPFTYTGGSLKIAIDMVTPPNNWAGGSGINWERSSGSPVAGGDVTKSVIGQVTTDGTTPELLNATGPITYMGRPIIRITYITNCDTPAPVEVKNITSNSVDINWNSFFGASGYEYAITPTSTAPASGMFTNDTSNNVTGLSTGTVYYAHVRTKCGSKFSPWTSIQFNTTCPKPVTVAMETNVQSGTAEITWNKINGVMGYEYSILKEDQPPTWNSAAQTTDTIARLTGLIPGVKYYFHVRSHCKQSLMSDWTTLEFFPAGIGIYPNPARDKVLIKVSGIITSNNGTILVSDAVGRVLRKLKLTGNTVELDISGFAAGIYFIRYIGHNEFVTKMVKQ